MTIGSNNNPVKSITFESQNSYSDVNAVFFYALTNKDVSYEYEIYVGDSLVYSGSIVSNTPTYYGGTFEAKSGKIKLVLGTKHNLNGMSFCGLAFNY